MKKNQMICIRATEAQKKYILNQIKKNNINNISEYVLKCCMNKPITHIEGLEKVIYQLRKIGNNINQLAKKANQGIIINSSDVREIKIELQQIWLLLNSLTDMAK